MRALLRTSLFTLALALPLAPATARAEADPSRVTQASNFFDAGAQAYKAGQYQVAAEAFLKAHELVPSSALLFSAAQAYRRHYLTERTPEALRRAIGLYRDYLRSDPRPKRREDALQALELLVPLDTSSSALKEGAPRDPAAPPKDGELAGVAGVAPVAAARGTRLLLSTRTDGAEASVDGGPFVATPVVARVAPGPHRVVVRAAGYFEEQLTVPAVADELMPRLIALRPKPARLRVSGTAGARVSIDGQPLATLPTTALAIEPGSHFISVTLPGHEPFGKLLDLERDTSVDLPVKLRMTPQRIAAWSLFSVAAGAAVASGVLTGFTLSRERTAVALRDQRVASPLSPDDRDRYNAAVSARNDFARAAGITGGAAGLLLATFAGLYALDKQDLVPPSGDRRKDPADTTPRAEFDVGLLSLGVRGVF